MLLRPESDFSLDGAVDLLNAQMASGKREARAERHGKHGVRLRFPRWSLFFSIWNHEFLAVDIREIAEGHPHPSFPQEWVAGCDRMVLVDSEDTDEDMDDHYNDYLLTVEAVVYGFSGVLMLEYTGEWCGPRDEPAAAPDRPRD
jgi:hypothetical protein